MRVIIAGCREFNDYDLLETKTIEILKQLKSEGYNTKRENLTIVSGRARGADKLGEQFAEQYNINVKYFPADWGQFGKRAGYLRNSDMAKYAKEDEEIGVLMAYWDGTSKGTKHMIDLANKYGLRVFVVSY